MLLTQSCQTKDSNLASLKTTHKILGEVRELHTLLSGKICTSMLWQIKMISFYMFHVMIV